MRRHLGFVALVVISTAVAAFTPGTDHTLLNATSGTILVDIHSSGSKPITHFRLASGYSVGFDGIFSSLRVQFPGGKTLQLSQQQLTRLRSGAAPATGAWLIEDSGLRYVSHRDYRVAYRRFHKLWP